MLAASRKLAFDSNFAQFATLPQRSRLAFRGGLTLVTARPFQTIGTQLGIPVEKRLARVVEAAGLLEDACEFDAAGVHGVIVAAVDDARAERCVGFCRCHASEAE